jgi:hypothetical protein
MLEGDLVAYEGEYHTFQISRLWEHRKPRGAWKADHLWVAHETVSKYRAKRKESRNYKYN